MKTHIFRFFLPICALITVYAVDRSKFKTCDQVSFCRRQRAVQDGTSTYELVISSVKISDQTYTADVINNKNGIVFALEIYALKDSTFRVKFNEKNPIYPRYEDPYALLDDLSYISLKVNADGLKIKSGNNEVVLSSSPFRLDFYQANNLVVSVNARGLMKFEHYRKKPSETDEQSEDNENAKDAEETDVDGLWEESFQSHTDSKPRGPSSIGVDIAFWEVNNVYGIPEHADSFSLKETSSTDPYRLYNLDVFEYELWNPMALYASIPVMYGHSSSHTAGIFWHNAAETWIDIKRLPESNVVSSIKELFSRSDSEKRQVSTHWMSESGIIDLFVMLGPRPKDVFRQYSKLTGVTPLPPLFSLGYHQCRWNYNDEKDVQQVHDNMDKFNLPMDTIWLDIEHTDGKKYFTWDPHKFPNPIEMTNNLTARGRKLVTIVDPHIKIDSNYFYYKENLDLDFYIKNKDGSNFDGWCWPGSSSYIDFTNSKAKEHYINTFSLDRYKGSTLDTFTWNDMNEPSVFNGPEVTMQKDCIHPGINVEHREMHNSNALLFHAATYEAHLRRSEGKLRPFVLTRGAFSGSQRTSAIWTGDNIAKWDHLKVSVPMILSLSVSGMTFVGADIGGFFDNPDKYLLARWYQAAAFTPFFRQHAHIDTKRREPYLYDKETVDIIRDALLFRYRLLPYWYTLFYENEVDGYPPMRPLWVEFPTDQETFNIDDEYLLGPALLVRPVVDEAATTVNVYFPPANWVDFIDGTIYKGPSTININAPRDKIPVFQKCGSIIPTKDRTRRSATVMRDDPYTLYIALDSNQQADGILYIDDEHTVNYQSGEYLYLRFKFNKNLFTSKILHPAGKYKTGSWLERVVILGLNIVPSKIVLNIKGEKKVLEGIYTAEYNKVASKFVIRRPAVSMNDEFTIELF